jgi:hypothetical protein
LHTALVTGPIAQSLVPPGIAGDRKSDAPSEWHRSCILWARPLDSSLFGAGRISRMNAYTMQQCAAGRLVRVTLATWLVLASGALAAVEEKIAVLQIGTRTYKNVTVTSKAKNYVFIVHDEGMTSLKPAELPLDIQQELGYAPTGEAKSSTNTAAAWAKREIAKINVPQITELHKELDQKLGGRPASALAAMQLLGPTLIFAILGAALLVYLFFCYCCMLICQKTGNPPGIFVWLPVLKLFPLLRAADMSGWWFLAWFVPVLNVVAPILWCFKIAKARGKTAWIGLFLLLPITNLFAFLYLAFSNGGRTVEDEEAEPQIMTLEAA